MDGALQLLRVALLRKKGHVAVLASLVALFKLWKRWQSQRHAPSYTGWFQMTSPLYGSTAKYTRPTWKYGADAVTWRGFCPCCKKPVELEECSAPTLKGCLPGSRGKYAYVITLWGESPAYVLGAIVLGFSIQKTKTPHDLICIHTNDIPKDMLAIISKIWDCRLVDHVESTKELTTWKEPNRFDNVFTKLRCLSLVEYEKVLMMDIDLLVTTNIDELFELRAPAALRRGMNEGRWKLQHGDWIDGRAFFSGAMKGQYSWGQATGINAGVMLLQPDMDTFNNMIEEIKDPCHPSHCAGNGPEQDYLSRYWAESWSQLSVQYNYQLHQMFFALQPDSVWTADRNRFLSNAEGIKIVHFSGEGIGKPWCRVLPKAEDAGRWPWPDRSYDADYIRACAETFRGYWLWIKKDKEWWEQLSYARDTDGFELRADGHIYRCPKYGENWGSGAEGKSSWNNETSSWNKAEEERVRVDLPDWATKGAMSLLESTLLQWFDTCEELETSWGIDIGATLRRASATDKRPENAPCEDLSNWQTAAS